MTTCTDWENSLIARNGDTTKLENKPICQKRGEMFHLVPNHAFLQLSPDQSVGIGIQDLRQGNWLCHPSRTCPYRHIFPAILEISINSLRTCTVYRLFDKQANLTGHRKCLPRFWLYHCDHCHACRTECIQCTVYKLSMELSQWTCAVYVIITMPACLNNAGTKTGFNMDTISELRTSLNTQNSGYTYLLSVCVKSSKSSSMSTSSNPLDLHAEKPQHLN